MTRKGFTFSLRTLLKAVTVLCVVLGIYTSIRSGYYAYQTRGTIPKTMQYEISSASEKTQLEFEKFFPTFFGSYRSDGHSGYGFTPWELKVVAGGSEFVCQGLKFISHFSGERLSVLHEIASPISESRLTNFSASQNARVCAFTLYKDGNRIWIWNIDHDDRAKELANVDFPIGDLAVSSDGKLIAVSRDDHFNDQWDPVAKNKIDKEKIGEREFPILLLDVKSGVKRGHLDGHIGEVDAIQFLPDNKSLVSLSHDRTIRIWNVEINQEQKRFGTPISIPERVKKQQLLRQAFSHLGNPRPRIAVSDDGIWACVGRYMLNLNSSNLELEDKSFEFIFPSDRYSQERVFIPKTHILAVPRTDYPGSEEDWRVEFIDCATGKHLPTTIRNAGGRYMRPDWVLFLNDRMIISGDRKRGGGGMFTVDPYFRCCLGFSVWKMQIRE